MNQFLQLGLDALTTFGVSAYCRHTRPVEVDELVSIDIFDYTPWPESAATGRI